MPFSRLSFQASENMTEIARRCLSVVPADHRAWTFNTSNLATGVLPLVEDIKKWDRPGSYIYYFQCAGDADLAKILDVFRYSKLRDKGLRSYARPNEVSPCLYVGGSKNIVARLKQHLGYSTARGTYSLQLLHWATSLSFDLILSCALYSSEHAQDVLQALEDTLWDINMPMLGRMSTLRSRSHMSRSYTQSVPGNSSSTALTL